MYRRCAVLFLLISSAWCQQNSSPSLTIYNQNFAVVREIVPLQLHTGENHVSFDNVTSFLEPSSVVLRDPNGRVHLNILEQNYRTDVASQQNLLRAYEGKEIEFQVTPGNIVRERSSVRVVWLTPATAVTVETAAIPARPSSKSTAESSSEFPAPRSSLPCRMRRC
jgi:hypothetical protein